MPILRRAVLLIVTVALMGAPALVISPAPAQAATGYSLVAGGARIAKAGTAAKLTVVFRKDGKAVKKATAWLQYRNGSTWVNEKKLTIRSGKAKVSVKHPGTERTYRFTVPGLATSTQFVVRFAATKFTLTGSGFGHGVGLAQWGAYQQSRTGASAADILTYYYPGATLGTAVNNPRTVKVQVFGPPADSAATTTITTPGGFTVRGDGKVLASSSGAGRITVGVSGAKVRATVTSGATKNKALALSSRLTITWTKGPVTVAGAQGSYQYGNLQVTAIKARPNVINELAMNTEYLYGIDEMPSSWGNAGGVAALKAQAIAARNYIINKVVSLKAKAGGVDPACDCHVFDDTRSQNFVGWKKAGGSANQPWIDAVKSTIHSSQVDVVRDPSAGLAETPFFASSGRAAGSGTASNADVFGTPALSYLASVADPYSAAAPGNPNLSWSRTFTAKKLATVLGTKQQLVRLEIVDRYPGGLVKSLRYTTASGAQVRVTRTAEAWRTGLGLPGGWLTKIAGR
jgi:stage II sporulation protein D